MATVAVFIALGGSAYAATQLKKNSVGTKQIKNQAITAAKIKNRTIAGASSEWQLDWHPDQPLDTGNRAVSHHRGFRNHGHNSQHSKYRRYGQCARGAGTRAAGGARNQPPFLDGSLNRPPTAGLNFQAIGFYRDHEGIVHLQGIATVGKEEKPVKGLIFQLPPGFRPASGVVEAFPGLNESDVFVLGRT